MQLKTTEIDGTVYAEVVDGKPVYLIDDKPTPFDAAHAAKKISDLNGEAKSHRLAAEDAAKKLKAYEGIEDPDKARKALETLASLDAKQLIDAGKVDEIKAAAIAAGNEKLDAAVKAKDAEIMAAAETIKRLRGTLDNELIGGSFARSKFVNEALAIPADLVKSRFAQHFRIEDDQSVVAYDAQGNKIYSKSKPGEVASFDEAIETIIGQYPYKEDILKGTQHQGGGAVRGSAPGSRTMTLAEFNALPAKARAAKMAEAGFTISD